MWMLLHFCIYHGICARDRRCRWSRCTGSLGSICLHHKRCLRDILMGHYWGRCRKTRTFLTGGLGNEPIVRPSRWCKRSCSSFHHDAARLKSRRQIGTNLSPDCVPQDKLLHWMWLAITDQNTPQGKITEIYLPGELAIDILHVSAVTDPKKLEIHVQR